VIEKSISNDVGLHRDSVGEFKTETRDFPKNGSARKTYTRNKLSRRKAPRMEGVSGDKITEEYMLKTQKLCDEQSFENQKKPSKPQINNSKKIAIKNKPEVNVLSKKLRCVTDEVEEENADGEAATGANMEESPSDCVIPVVDGGEHVADAELLAKDRGVPAIDSTISMVDGENFTSIDHEVLAKADAETFGVNLKASASNRGVTAADEVTSMSGGETSAVTQWLRLTLPVLRMISRDVQRLKSKDRHLLKRKWSSIMDY